MSGKMIIYQMLPRLWGNMRCDQVHSGTLEENGCGKFHKIDDESLTYLKGLEVTHVWYTGIIRHATTESFEGCPASNPMIVKGKAGSPYAIVDYFDVNPYLAENPADRMDEFESLVNRTHSHGIKVIIDFIPNHVSRDYGKVGMVREPDEGTLGAGDDSTVHWRPENDFFYYPGQELSLPVRPPSDASFGSYHEYPAKASGNTFSPSPGVNDWYETIRLNYCYFHTKTWDKMLEIALYWCGKGVDAFRCDMVEMVPWQFMKWLISSVKEKYPDVLFIAEVYQKDLYRHYVEDVGFDYIYDKSGLYDILRAIVEGHGSTRSITSNWQSLADLQPRMLNFLENHDEQRFASRFFAGSAGKAGAPLCVSLMFNTAPFMIYSGEELGETGEDEEGFSGLDGRTSIFDWWSPDSMAGIYEFIHTWKPSFGIDREAQILFIESLELARRPVVAAGTTFDLCYCNMDSPGFDPDRHFVFARSLHGKALLFACNFSGEDADILVKVPQEAIAYMGLKKTEAFEMNVSVKAYGYSVLPV